MTIPNIWNKSVPNHQSRNQFCGSVDMPCPLASNFGLSEASASDLTALRIRTLGACGARGEKFSVGKWPKPAAKWMQNEFADQMFFTMPVGCYQVLAFWGLLDFGKLE